jgi:poly(A) polymerase
MHSPLHHKSQPEEPTPLIIPRADHPISRKKIDRNALKIMYRLKDHGYLAYLVGGAVRDMLLGRQPADFDIVTDAKPSQIKKLFRNSRIIGRRFRLAHIFFTDRITGRQQIIEVATFRKKLMIDEKNLEMVTAKPTMANNTYGTPAEDVQRRDFTINALFYSLDRFKVIDYLGGLEDLGDGIVRIIGDPYERLIEDPVRILRAMEFSCRLGFTLEEQTLKAMQFHAPLLKEVSPSRMHEELRGLYTKGTTSAMLDLAAKLGIISSWLPYPTSTMLPQTRQLMQKMEEFFSPVTNEQQLESLIVTSLLLPEVVNRCGISPAPPLHQVNETVELLLHPLNDCLHLPRYQRHRVREIMIGIFRLCSGDKRIKKLRKRPNFYSSLFFFIQLGREYPQELGKTIGFWHKQVSRWPTVKDNQLIDPKMMFLNQEH